jgi:hypothetical protein
MGSCQPRLTLIGLTGGIRGNHSSPELAHAARCRDGREPIQLRISATSGRPHLPERQAQKTRSRNRTNPVGRHHRQDPALTRVEIGHQVGSPREPVPQLQPIERVGAARRGPFGRNVELDAHAGAEAREVPAFPKPPATMIDRQPKSPDKMVFVSDAARGHDDRRDRVVHDFFLRVSRHASTLAPAPQLADQLSTTPVQLPRGLLRRPASAAAPRPDHTRPPRPPT